MKLRLPWAPKPHNYLVLLGFIALAQAAGGIGSLATFSAIPTWYATLVKPAFSPPNFVFGPVWTLLYTLMGISAYLIWHQFGFGKKARAYWIAYWTQLVLNTLWSLIFFGLHWTLFAFVEIVIMWWFILRTIRAGSKLNPVSSYLLYPYLAWVSFASLLNLSIYLLN